MKGAANQSWNLIGGPTSFAHFTAGLAMLTRSPNNSGSVRLCRESCLTCRHHQRCAGDAGVQQIAQAMAKSTSGVEIEDARTTGSLRIAVRHGNRAGLLSAHT